MHACTFCIHSHRHCLSTTPQNTMPNVKVKITPSSSRLPQSTSTTTTTAAATNPDLRPFFSRLSASLRRSFSQRRPWLELVDRSSFSRPETLSEATSRVRKNLSYFRVNYTAIVAVIALLSLLSHPFPLFFCASLLGAWIYLYLFRPPDQPLLLFHRLFSDREILGILILSSIMIVFLTGLGSLLISSVIFGFGITCVHGAFRVPQEVFVEDQKPMDNTGLLSFLVGTAASTAVAAAPRTRVPRV